MSESSRVVDRQDRHVASDPGIEIFVREVRAQGEKQGVPVLLVHGGGPGGVESFDLPVLGFSLAEDLASAGHVVYVMDVRGWARSTRPPALEEPPERHPPAVRSEEAVRDIGAVVSAARHDHEGRRVALVGWATGGHWSAMYAAGGRDSVSHLVMVNSLYGVDAPWLLRAALEADGHPGEFDRRAGAYGLRTAEGLLAQWDASIPVADKSEWRDPRVAEAYVDTALASDPLSDTHTPPAMRIPSGFQLDSYEMSRGWRPWQARDVIVPTLVIRGERDFWSRPEDLAALERELVGTPRVRTITIPEATHYLLNDRPERGRARFLDEVTAFLAVEE